MLVPGTTSSSSTSTTRFIKRDDVKYESERRDGAEPS